MTKLYRLIILLLLAAGIFFRLYHVEFGLPHSFYADEPEIAELAIKYTFELRNIIANNDYYKLIPISFVYGTFPAYLNTLLTMFYSKTSNLAGMGFDKTGIYVFLRGVNALFSMLIVVAGGILSQKLFKNKWITLVSIALLALNWKLIVHAHYINADITQTIILSLAYLSLLFYYKNMVGRNFTILTGILLGIAIGTKITTLIALPLFVYIYWVRKDYRGLVALLFISFGAYLLTNPFSFIFADRFAFRIYQMLTKEAGLVFDSVDGNPFKYLISLGYIATPVAFFFSLYGMYKSLRPNLEDNQRAKNTEFHIFLILNIVIYVAFFSLQGRRVDRWLLPVLPIVLIYCSAATVWLVKQSKSLLAFAVVFLVFGLLYMHFPALLLQQFQRHTPKSAAYIWMRDNTDPSLNKLVYTEEGLDPMNKLQGVRVLRMQVYTDESAQFFVPENPEGYHYVVLSSRPFENFKRPQVREQFPFYAEKWDAFEQTIQDPNQFELINQFVLPKPNLIPLSDVYIYQNLNPVEVLEQETSEEDESIIDSL